MERWNAAWSNIFWWGSEYGFSLDLDLLGFWVEDLADLEAPFGGGGGVIAAAWEGVKPGFMAEFLKPRWGGGVKADIMTTFAELHTHVQ